MCRRQLPPRCTYVWYICTTYYVHRNVRVIAPQKSHRRARRAHFADCRILHSVIMYLRACARRVSVQYLCVCVWCCCWRRRWRRRRRLAAMRPQLLAGVIVVGVKASTPLRYTINHHRIVVVCVCFVCVCTVANYTAMSYLLGVFDQPTHTHTLRIHNTHMHSCASVQKVLNGKRSAWGTSNKGYYICNCLKARSKVSTTHIMFSLLFPRTHTHT